MKRKSDMSGSKIPHSKHHDKSENSEPPKKRLYKGTQNEPVMDISSEAKEKHHHKHDEAAIKRKSDGEVQIKENKIAKSNDSKPIPKSSPPTPQQKLEKKEHQQPPQSNPSSIPPPSKLKRKNNPLALKNSKPSLIPKPLSSSSASSSTTTPEPPITTKKSPKVTKVKPDQANNDNSSPPKPRSNRAMYFMTKGMVQPPHHGELDMPVGKPNCLANKTFVLTGVCDHFTREELTELVQEYGGRVTTAVSGKTSYLLIGNTLEDGRPVTEGSKYKKAKEQTHTPIIDEQQFYDLINKTNPNPNSTSTETEIKNNEQLKSDNHNGSMRSIMSISIPIDNNNNNIKNIIMKKGQENELWTDKYKPTKINDIVGNSNNIKQLKEWLENWESLHLHLSSENQSNSTTPSKDDKSKKTPAKRRNDSRKAVLISGPPGIGKTTTATIIGKELGYEIFEMNASDTRNKTAIEDQLKEAINGNCVISFTVKNNHNRLVIMDEVDGMSSGDRGGMNELIKQIDKCKCPIICICNDRQNTNIRTLANHCKDLQFMKPPLISIRNRMMNIAKGEGLTIDINAMDTIIESSNYDIRQILNNMQMLRKTQLSVNKTYISNHVNNTSKDVVYIILYLYINRIQQIMHLKHVK